MTTRNVPISDHPDLVAMRERYDQMAETTRFQLADGLVFLAGLWLVVSPWVISFAGAGALPSSDLITGLALAVLALGFASAYAHTHSIAWVVPVLGAWTVVSPWLVMHTNLGLGAMLSTVITGVLVVILGLGTVGLGGVGGRRAMLMGMGRGGGEGRAQP